MADGRVEAVVQGDRTQIEALVRWLHIGPPVARVDAVAVAEQPLQHFEHFEIRR